MPYRTQRRHRGKIGILLVLSVAAIILLRPVISLCCAPEPDRAIFVPKSPPEPPLEDFVKGDLGILQPSFARSFLYVAYRNLIGPGFDAEEQKAVLAVWLHRISRASDWDGAEGIKEWVALRGAVTGEKLVPKIYEHDAKYKSVDSLYESYLNCHDDAFLIASRTLHERIKQFGLKSPVVFDWVQAQDQVFTNCSGPETIPSDPKLESEPLVRADRAYQIASAYFYAGNFDKSEELYTKIVNDASSPWRNIAPYLIGRALLRKATLVNSESDKAGSEGEKSKEALARAEKQFRAVISDPSLTSTHPAAERMLNLIHCRLEGPARMQALANQLLASGSAKTMAQDLCDYTILMDNMAQGNEGRYDDMTTWIFNFRNADPQDSDETPDTGGKDRVGKNGRNADTNKNLGSDGDEGNREQKISELEFALRKYKETPSSPAWLVASISRIGAGHPDLPMILDAASKVPPSSPAFLTVTYHRARCLIEVGDRDAARTLLDGLFSDKDRKLSRSSCNLLLALRLGLAQNFGDLLRDAPRIPMGIGSGVDLITVEPYISQQNQGQAADTSNEQLEILKKGTPLLDDDSCRIFNGGLPTSLLLQAARSEILTPVMRLDLTRALWVRAIALGDEKLSLELAAMLKAIDPPLIQHMEFFLAPGDSKERFFNALLTIMRVPGLRPYITPGLGRTTPIGEFDSLRDNWWDESLGMFASGSVVDMLEFLTNEERSTAKRELAALGNAGSVYDSVLPELFRYSQENPKNPNIPETLHRIVQATRFCECSKLSRDAFQLLHKRYPKDPWTKQTRYWY